MNLGELLQTHKKDIAGAEREYQLAIKLDPNNAVAHTNLGALLYGKGDKAGSKAAYTRVLEIDPNNTAVRKFLKTLSYM